MLGASGEESADWAETEVEVTETDEARLMPTSKGSRHGPGQHPDHRHHRRGSPCVGGLAHSPGAGRAGGGTAGLSARRARARYRSRNVTRDQDGMAAREVAVLATPERSGVTAR